MTWITLEKHNIKNICKKELVKPNSPLSIKEIKHDFKLSYKENPGPPWPHWQIQQRNREITPI